MENNVAQKTSKYKLFIFIGIEILIVLTIFLLIFFAGRRTYTVTFDINGGELLSGDLEQEVRRGGSATPPNVARQGCYLLRWSGSYSKVTGNVKCTAIWEYETTAGIEYEIVENGNYCLVSGCYKELSGDVYVGAYYDGLKVLGIKDGAFKDCKYIESLFFLDGIISIGKSAFEGCESLETITLPETAERIGDRALANCTSLERIIVPDTTKQIGTEVFMGCTSLKEVEILGKVEVLSERIFADCTSLESVLIPDVTKQISTEAFMNCAALTKLDIVLKGTPLDNGEYFKDDEKDDGKEEDEPIEKTLIIGDRAFSGCASLESATFLDKTSEIGNEAFLNCTSLTSFTINDRVEKIGDRAFLGCQALVEIKIPESVVEMGEQVFDNPELTIFVDILEEEIPETWNEAWVGENKSIEYRIPELVEDTTETE